MILRSVPSVTEHNVWYGDLVFIQAVSYRKYKSEATKRKFNWEE
jgi:hypothetical protein